MMAVAVGVAFLGYSVGVWGYCLVRGYDVTFGALWKTTWPGPAAPASTLPLPADPGTGTYVL
jgi:hypothetical protein